MHLYLETDRLILRRFTLDDEQNLVELDSDPAVMRFLTGGRPTPPEVIAAEVLPRILSYYEKYPNLGLWAALEKSTGQFIGWFHLRPPYGSAGSHPGAREHATDPNTALDVAELGYRLRRSAWGKGYATEGSLALIRKGFTELGIRRVVAHTMAVNVASRRVMEKVGLSWQRTFHRSWPDAIEGAEHGDVEYALDQADWRGG